MNEAVLEQMRHPADKRLIVWQHKTLVSAPHLELLRRGAGADYLISHFTNIDRVTNKQFFHQAVRGFTSNLIPRTFSLPAEFRALCRARDIKYFIVKANNLSRGREISIARNPLEINYKT